MKQDINTLLANWFSLMRTEHDFFTYALELAIYEERPYDGRLGSYNPSTHYLVTADNKSLYITRDFIDRVGRMLNNLTKCDYEY